MEFKSFHSKDVNSDAIITLTESGTEHSNSTPERSSLLPIKVQPI